MDLRTWNDGSKFNLIGERLERAFDQRVKCGAFAVVCVFIGTHLRSPGFEQGTVCNVDRRGDLLRKCAHLLLQGGWLVLTREWEKRNIALNESIHMNFMTIVLIFNFITYYYKFGFIFLFIVSAIIITVFIHSILWVYFFCLCVYLFIFSRRCFLPLPVAMWRKCPREHLRCAWRPSTE